MRKTEPASEAVVFLSTFNLKWWLFYRIVLTFYKWSTLSYCSILMLLEGVTCFRLQTFKLANLKQCAVRHLHLFLFSKRHKIACLCGTGLPHWQVIMKILERLILSPVFEGPMVNKSHNIVNMTSPAATSAACWWILTWSSIVTQQVTAV